MSITKSCLSLVAAMLGLGLCAQSTDTVLTTYPDTDQRWEKIYAQGEKVAENIYYTNDTAWMTVRYDRDEVEHWKWYYDNGNPYFEATIINDWLQGSYKIWYEDGQLAEEIFFEDHVENGPAIFYHPNGQIAMQGLYRDGEMVGDGAFFDKNGHPPNGNWSWPFAASLDNIRVEGQFKNGQPTGTWTYRGTGNQGRSSQLQFQRLYD